MDILTLEAAAARCKLCTLHKGRNKPVFAKGNPQASVMICGMVPANEENKVGLPFVGRAGQLLDKILADVNWSLDDVYITNLVKCYLAAGQPLQQTWIDACLPYLLVQIHLIKPKIIITLGKDSSVTVLGMSDKTTMGSIRGKVFEYIETTIIPTYHPSYLLRGGGERHKSYSKVIEDFTLAKNLLDK
jgi:uracil-DNA glycosylase family 4